MEGRIVQKLECRPYADTCYMKLKKESIRRASMPQRKVQQWDKVVPIFKPVSDHKHNVSFAYIFFNIYHYSVIIKLYYFIILFKIEYQERKKAEGKKARDDKDAVLNMLFAAFEKHQYYNIKDLQKVFFFIFHICNFNISGLFL